MELVGGVNKVDFFGGVGVMGWSHGVESRGGVM